MVDKHEAVKVCDLEKNMEPRQVVKPNFTTHFLKQWFGKELMS